MMYYYTFNIGDYASHTKGLTLLEDLAYRRLLDEYYLAERPLNGCSTTVARMIGMRGHEAEVEYILHSFFTQNEQGGWVNDRADREIQHFKSKSEKAAQAGKASAARRLNERSTGVERTLNERQLTNNQEPITNKQDIKDKQQAVRATPSVIHKPDDVDEQVWKDWLQHRKLKKAVVTETVLKTIEREALKASMTLQDALETMCSRGWTGFKSDWMINGNAQSIKKQKNVGAFDEFLGEQNVIEFNNQTGEWK